MRSEGRPKDCLFGDTDQAAFDAGEMQRDASTCRARSRAAICNAASYINIGCAFLMKVNDALILPYKQSGVHSWKWRDRHFVWWNNRACTYVYRLSFCLRGSLKNITVVYSFSCSCWQNALTKRLVKPLSNCRSRNSGNSLSTLQAFRVSWGVCLFRRNVLQWLTRGHTKFCSQKNHLVIIFLKDKLGLKSKHLEIERKVSHFVVDFRFIRFSFVVSD